MHNKRPTTNHEPRTTISIVNRQSSIVNRQSSIPLQCRFALWAEESALSSVLSADDRERLTEVLERAVEALRGQQKSDGHWCGELQGDSILESEYLLMKFILGQENQPMADGSEGLPTLKRIANYLRKLQRPDGGWGQYPGSGIDLSATVKAYFALKLMGDDPDASHMAEARRVIRTFSGGGGAEQCNSFTNFYLACLGQVSWNAVPAIPPEIIFLPRWFYFHMSKVSAWTRTMILPLSLVVTLRSTRKLAPHQGIDELFVDQRARHMMKNKALSAEQSPAWSGFFMLVDSVLKFLHKFGGTPVRRLAIKRAEQWILQRAGQDGVSSTAGLGAIFPPMVYLQIALMALGYRRDHPVIQRAERELDEFFIPNQKTGDIRIQPCFSPVWDTGIALYALTDCGLDHRDSSVRRAAEWLVSKECRHKGDSADNVAAGTQPAGWYFEYHNAWYPDVDDTAMVAMALKRAGLRSNESAAKRGVQWMLAMQNDDGGWAAFDKTTHRQILEYIPFADHNAMQDPSCPDITGRVLECLSWHGFDFKHPAVMHAIDYIKSHQHPEGCFFGRWGVNYIYGTWQAVIGPIRCGVSRDDEWIQRAGKWIKSIQKEDGSFGESANSYADPSLKGQGPSTASQTAWAAMILQEVFGPDDRDLKRAINWLASTQLDEADATDPQKNPDGDLPGGWVEPWFTGTGFPRVFYLRYHLYRLYFPVMAIGRYLAAHGITLHRELELTAVCQYQPAAP
jgi:squalene-hopene/tetraprenyl-beta-curcumene cyclase